MHPHNVFRFRATLIVDLMKNYFLSIVQEMAVLNASQLQMNFYALLFRR